MGSPDTIWREVERLIQEAIAEPVPKVQGE
jgi:hypothetical protein